MKRALKAAKREQQEVWRSTQLSLYFRGRWRKKRRQKGEMMTIMNRNSNEFLNDRNLQETLRKQDQNSRLTFILNVHHRFVWNGTNRKSSLHRRHIKPLTEDSRKLISHPINMLITYGLYVFILVGRRTNSQVNTYLIVSPSGRRGEESGARPLH